MVDLSDGLIKSRVLMLAQANGCPEDKLDDVWEVMRLWEYPADPSLIESDVVSAIRIVV